MGRSRRAYFLAEPRRVGAFPDRVLAAADGVARPFAFPAAPGSAAEDFAAAVAKVAGVTPDQSRLAGAIDSAIGERR